MTDLLDLAARVADQAAAGEAVEVFVARRSSTTVRAYDGDVESLTAAESLGVGVRVVVGQRQGFAHAGTLDADIVAGLLEEARDNARFGEPDEHLGVAAPDGVPAVELDHWNDEIDATPTADKVEVALDLERRVRAADRRITGVRSAAYSDGAGEMAIATSTGIRVADRGVSASVSVSAIAADGEQTQMGTGFDVARRPSELDLDRAVDDAVLRATRLLGATKPSTTRLAIVLEPRLAASFIGLVVGMLGAERVLKGRSPFADRVGESIASSLLSVIEDPTNPLSFGADRYDSEGLACRPTVLLESGNLAGFLHNTYTARRAGATTTASAIRGFRSTPAVGARAVAVEPGSGDLQSLLAGVDHGLYVQSLIGLHSGVNGVSGDFSVGADGLMIRDGALAEPVREATIASTIQRMLADIVAVGADVEWQPGGTGAVTLVVGDMALSGA